MAETALIRWLSMLSKGVCTVSPYSRIVCMVLAFFAWDAFSSSQEASRDERAFERELILRQLNELERQADHKRIMEVIEALKNRRDLTLPADPDEGF
jgi:hypothetical protein